MIFARSGTNRGGKSGRGRLCFYAPHLYPVTAGGEIELVGGAEVIQWSLGRGLAARGFEVSIVTCDYGQPERVEREGVSLLRAFSPQAGVRILRFFYPRLWKASIALWRVRADVYLTQGSGIEAGLAYEVARLRRAAFVFLAAHDFDALTSLPVLPRRRHRWWYLRALKGAEMRIAQTGVQRRLFLDNFGLETPVIGNPAELPSRGVDAAANRVVLWLATYKPSKRPEWFTELARRLPEHQFVMVGGLPGSSDKNESWESARRAADECSNLTVYGFVERERIGDFLEQAAVFVHTSPAEGFPMAVLEAWSYGIPSITAVDPDGAVARFGLGDVVTTIDGLVEAVVRLMNDDERRRSAGARARAYVEQHHAQNVIYDEMALLLDTVIEKRMRSGRAR
jgi:glycosyltransferase involved in cell wall biosynthesis